MWEKLEGQKIDGQLWGFDMLMRTVSRNISVFTYRKKSFLCKREGVLYNSGREIQSYSTE